MTPAGPIRFLFCCCLFLQSSLFPAHLQSQELHFEQINARSGLSQNSVSDMLQDRHGFLWFATQDGVNRYDGQGFTIYRHDPDAQEEGGNGTEERGPAPQQGLTDNTAWTLHEDREGALWIGTANGLNRLSPDRRHITHHLHRPGDPESLSDSAVNDLLEDDAGRLWIATSRGGLNRLDRESGTFDHFRHDPADPASLPSDQLNRLARTPDGMIWIGTEDAGLVRFDPEAETFRHFPHEPGNPDSLSGPHVTDLLVDSRGILWIATFESGLNRLDPASGTIRRYRHDPDDPQSISSDDLRTLYEDDQGRFWVGHYLEGGLDLFDRERGSTIRQYTNEPGVPYSLSDNHVISLLQDDSGVFWVGTHVGGLNWHHDRHTRFQHFRNEWWNDNSLSHNTVRSFLQEGDTLYIGTEGGLNVLDLPSGRFTHYRHDPDSPDGLPHDIVRAIDRDGQGRLWLATHGGLSRFDPATGTFTTYRHDPDDPDSLSGNVVWRVHVDRRGMVWAGARDALNRLDPKTGVFERFHHDPDDPGSIAGDRIIAIHEDSSGRMWFSTVTRGVNRLDPGSDRFVRYTHDPDDPDSLNNPFVFSITEDEQGRLWFGTRGGLNRHDPESGRFTHFTEEDGLANNVIYGILFDEEGHLWTSTNRGVSRFNPDTESFRNFTIDDGLQDDEFNNGAYHRAATGEMYFGGVNGFNRFRPGDLTISEYEPPAVITRFTVLNEERHVAPPSLRGDDPVLLKPDENHLSFEFAALDYSAPERIRYQHRLVGFDEQWRETGATERRFATYTNLPAGDYIFQVRATNADGVWSPHAAGLPVRITPTMWQSTGFRTALALLTVAVLAALYRYKTYSVRRRNQELKVMVEQRTARLQQEVEQRRDAEEEIRRIAYHDHLTGLPNRRLFLSLCRQALADARRSEFGVAMLFIDLDGFKAINDTRGHAAGDRVLVEVGRRIRDSVRENDVLCRVGGDEFVILLTGIRDSDRASRVARKLEKVLMRDIDLAQGDCVRVGASIGISLYPEDGVDVDGLLKKADHAMYRAKQSSGASYEFSGEPDST